LVAIAIPVTLPAALQTTKIDTHRWSSREFVGFTWWLSLRTTGAAPGEHQTRVWPYPSLLIRSISAC